MEDLQTVIKEMQLSGYNCSVIYNERVWDEKLKSHTFTGFSLLVTTGSRVGRIWKHTPNTYMVQVQKPYGYGQTQVMSDYCTGSLEDAVERLQRELKK